MYRQRQRSRYAYIDLQGKAYLDVAFETLKIRMVYKPQGQVFVGNLGGREFVVKESTLPNERQEYNR